MQADLRKIIEKTTPTSNQLNALIEPTKIYVKSILSLLKILPVHAISHITGGGLLENIPRVIPIDLTAKLNSNSWNQPEIFNWIQDAGTTMTEAGSVSEMPKTANKAVVAEAQTANLQAPTNGVLTDADLAAKYRSDADRLYKEAKALRAQAEELVPTTKKKTSAKATT